MSEQEESKQPIEGEQPVHKRRVRYKGTHPRSFEEKYKEHDPNKYPDEIAKIIESGKTPAGMHISIMKEEIIRFLEIKPGQVGYDATLGYGGHTQAMLEQLQGSGRLYATDVDIVEATKTKERLASLGYGDDIFTFRHLNFANVDQVSNGEKFDFVLADLGVSSMQLDNPSRGFSFKRNGPLDLRLDPTNGETAAQILRKMTYPDIVNLLKENSDEPYAEQIAKAILRAYKFGKEISTTAELYAVVEEALAFLPKQEKKDGVKKACQRVFQALRIEVNSEFEVLSSFLEKLPNCLNSGARVAVLTFHSGEDRMVKKAFKQAMQNGVYSEVARDVIRPSQEECYKNPRAHSTKMRWAIKA